MALNVEKLERLREAKGWDQDEAARRSGLGNKARWNDIVSGRRANVTLSTLDRIAEALGVPARDLIK